SAYDGFGPAWLAEGTAVWAQRVFDPDSKDFLRYGDAYLADHRRTLTKPPPGPVPAFAYGTALWWDFLSERHGTEIIVALMHASERIDAEAIDLPQAMADVVVAS